MSVTITAAPLSTQEALARNLVVLRARRKLAQAALAELAGVARATISNIERAEGWASLEVIDRLATALQVDVTTLLVKDSGIGPVSDDELQRLAAEGREDAVDARTLMDAIDEAHGHSPERYSNAGRPRNDMAR